MQKREHIKHLADYYERRLGEFISSIKKLGFGKQNVHKIRISLKKVRAVYRMHALLFPGMFSAGKHYDCFKKIFKKAGEIREAQLNKEGIAVYKINVAEKSAYRRYLELKEKTAKKQFKKAIAVFNYENIEKSRHKIAKLNERVTNAVVTTRCLTFIKREVARVENILAPKENSTEDFHKIRRHIKSIGAITTFLHGLAPNTRLGSMLPLIKKTETTIGTWHDKEVLIGSINSFLYKVNSEKKFARLKALPVKIEKENAQAIFNMKKEINLTMKTVHKLI